MTLCPSNTPCEEPDSAHWCALPEGHTVPLHQSEHGTVWTDQDAAERNSARRIEDLDKEILVLRRTVVDLHDGMHMLVKEALVWRREKRGLTRDLRRYQIAWRSARTRARRKATT